jgi:hypothetical protein
MLSEYKEFQQLVHEVEEMQDLNYEIMDTLRSKLVWLIKYCGQNNIILPDIEAVFDLIDKSGNLLEISGHPRVEDAF